MQSIVERLEETVPVKRGAVERIYSRKQIEQAFLETFELVGGVSRLASWADDEENYKDFLILTDIVQKQMELFSSIQYQNDLLMTLLN